MYKIGVYIPRDNVNEVKTAMFKAGGGRIGNYDCCSFEYEGLGQFRPLEGSNPHIGDKNQVEKVSEVRVEMVVDDKLINNVVEAMKTVHPYETVAFDVIKLENFS